MYALHVKRQKINKTDKKYIERKILITNSRVIFLFLQIALRIVFVAYQYRIKYRLVWMYFSFIYCYTFFQNGLFIIEWLLIRNICKIIFVNKYSSSHVQVPFKLVYLCTGCWILRHILHVLNYKFYFAGSLQSSVLFNQRLRHSLQFHGIPDRHQPILLHHPLPTLLLLVTQALRKPRPLHRLVTRHSMLRSRNYIFSRWQNTLSKDMVKQFISRDLSLGVYIFRSCLYHDLLLWNDY